MRWDVHNHAVPREAIEFLREADGFPITVEGDVLEADRVRAEMTPIFTDAAAKLAQLEELGLEAAVVSVSPALFAYETDEDRGVELARAVNNGLAADRGRAGCLLVRRRGARHAADAPPRLQQPPPRPRGLPPPERDRKPARDDDRRGAPDRDRGPRAPPETAPAPGARGRLHALAGGPPAPRRHRPL